MEKKKRNITLGIGLICLSIGLLTRNIWTLIAGGVLAAVGYMEEKNEKN